MTLVLRVAAPVGPEARDVRVVGRIPYGVVRRTRGAAPERFTAALPTELGPRAWRGRTPIATVVDGLETGRGDMRGRLLAAVRAMARAGATAEQIASVYVGPLYGDRSLSGHTFYLAGETHARSLHAWLLARVADEAEPLAARRALAWGLVDCAAAERWFNNNGEGFALPDAVEERRRGLEYMAERAGGSEPGPSGHDARLDALGVTPSRWAVDDSPMSGQQRMFDALARRGRALAVPGEVGEFPVSHDLLLYRLARLAEGLDGVLFSQRAPGRGDDDGVYGSREHPYTLHARFDGRHFRMHAENLGDYLDALSCVALVNSVLRARRSEWRLARLALDDEVTLAVAAPLAALRTLRRERLIRLRK
jgi:hypothetical protein